MISLTMQNAALEPNVLFMAEIGSLSNSGFVNGAIFILKNRKL